MPSSRFLLAKVTNSFHIHIGLCDPPNLHGHHFHCVNYIKWLPSRMKFPTNTRILSLGGRKTKGSQVSQNHCILNGGQAGNSDDFEDDEICPVDCVREFKTDEEFLGILKKAKIANSLVVVDFYRTSCGSCKYIEHGFVKLCKGSGDHKDAVIFLKHNVIDEYEEQSEVAERLRIKTVPLFHFYKGGVLLEAFATRDKERILAAINKYI